MANKYNIYKIPIERKADLLDKLKEVGLAAQKSIKSGDFTCTFYLSESPDPVDIWWVDLYKDFIEEPEDEFRNHLYFGVYIVYNDSVFYAISLGKSYFYLQSYCDMDFGLNLATRIIDPETIKLKNSRFFRSTKNKTITTYSASSLSYDSAESIYMLKASPEDKEIWGETISFGRSVQLSVECSPIDIAKLVNKIETALNEPIKVAIPMVLPVKNPEEIVNLDAKLFESLKNISDTAVDIDEIQTVGVAFIFAGQDNYQIYLPKSDLKSEIIVELSVSDIKSFIEENSIDHKTFELLKVKVIREEGRNYSVPIKKVLDYIEPESNHCLIEGTWNVFNDSYIKYLEDSVDKIELEKHNSDYDYYENETEGDYNKRISDDFNYTYLDKVLETIKSKYKIELMDLYKDGTLFFVKKGSAQKLTYCIDQGVNSLRYITSDENSELMDKNNMKLDKITVWLLLKTKPVTKLSNIKSLILLVKISELRKACLDKGVNLSVRLNYKQL